MARYQSSIAYDSVRSRVVLFGGFSGTAYLNDTWEWDGTRWTAVVPTSSPSPRAKASAAFDSARGKVVTFSGVNAPNDTFEYDGASWTPITTASPSARSAQAMTYDAARAKVVMFGGNRSSDNIELDETWAWDGTFWTQLFPSTAPPGRRETALAFDSSRGRVVLFGGTVNYAFVSDTWEWDGTNWTQKTTSVSPVARVGHSLAYDPVRSRVVLFGGQDADSRNLADTWEWDGTSWTPLATRADPGGRTYGNVAYETTGSRLLLFGGLTAAAASTQTWTLPSDPSAVNTPPRVSAGGSRVVTVGATVSLGGTATDDDGDAMTYQWTRKTGTGPADTLVNPTTLTPSFTPSGPGSQFFELRVTDARSAVTTASVLMYAERDTRQQGTWLQAAPVSSPSRRLLAGLVFESHRGRMLLFGGQGADSGVPQDTWEYDGTTWSSLSSSAQPDGMQGQALAYDSNRRRTVLFANLGRTWEWNDFNWIRLAPATSPCARSASAMAYDSGRGQTVLFGGVNGVPLADTWEWDGNRWLQRAPVTSPPGRQLHSLAYDPIRGRTILFGGNNASAILNDTWEWDGANWSQKVSPFSPPPRQSHQLAYDGVRKRALLFGGSGSEVGRALDTWAWDGTTWTLLTDAAPPPARSDPASGFDLGRGRLIVFGGLVGGDTPPFAVNDTWELPVGAQSNVAPSVSAGAASIATVSTAISLSATATDPDLDAVTYAWARSGGSGSAATLDNSSTATPTFTPAGTGDFRFVVTASDARGTTSTAAVTIYGVTTSTPTRSWLRSTPATSPVTHSGSAWAYDSDRGRFVLFGGGTPSRSLLDTWEYENGQWRLLFPRVSPPANSLQVMAYDSRRRRVVLFGGSNSLRQTWEFDGTAWHLVFPRVIPPNVTDAAMAFDAVRGRCVMFGTRDPDTGVMSTWEWDGTNWVQFTPASTPSQRTNPAMAFDARRGHVVLFGGFNTLLSVRQSDTWVWDGTMWTRLDTPSAPTGRYLHGMAYDSARDRMVVFGGIDSTETALADSWELEGTTWRALASLAVPGPRFGHLMDFDARRGRTVIFRGSATRATNQPTNETWELPTAPPGNSPPRASAGLSRIAPVGVAVHLAGTASDEDNDALSYSWQRMGSGPTVSLDNAALAAPTFTPSVRGEYEFRLTVTDGRGGSDQSTVAVQAFSPPQRTSDWRLMSPSTAPSARREVAMCRSATGKVLLFGGIDSRNALQQDTWEYDGGVWTKRAPVRAPSARRSTMAFDQSRGRVVLFGGDDTSDTWEFNVSDWIQIATVVTPPYRSNPALAYDSNRRRAVLFGGIVTGVAGADTWEWDGTAWAARTPVTSPAPRSAHSMAYDPASRGVLLFGGVGSVLYGDTWLWNGTAWTQLSPALSPSPRQGARMEVDSLRGRVVLFGGSNVNGDFLADTWEWSGSTWLPISKSVSPPRRASCGLAFEPSRGHLILFGGIDGSTTLGDTWELPGARTLDDPPLASTGFAQLSLVNGLTQLAGAGFDADGEPLAYAWRRSGGSGPGAALDDPSAVSPSFRPPALGTYDFALDVTDSQGATRSATVTVQSVSSLEAKRGWTPLVSASSPGADTLGMVYDSARQRTVLLRQGARETWELVAGQWVRRSLPTHPSGRGGAAMAYDSARRRTVLFGGSNTDETWEYDGNDWVRIVAVPSPAARTNAALAFDEARGEAVLFGGSGASLLADTWVWNGSVWSRRQPSTAPAPRSQHAMAYDAVRHVVVLFGGLLVSGSVNDTWEWDGSSWTRRTPPVFPAPRWAHAMAFDRARGKVVLADGLTFNGQPHTATWEWNGSDWRPIPLESYPPFRSGHGLAYDSAQGQLVLFGGTYSSTSFSDTWTLSSGRTLNSSPTASAGVARITTVGVPVTLAASGSDLDADLVSYSWSRGGGSGSPVVLSGSSSSTPSFTPSSAGSYEHVVTVADGRGGLATSPVTVFAVGPQGPQRSWQRLSLQVSPTPREDFGFDYDSLRNRTLLFGGADDTGSRNDTWEFDGTNWLERHPPAFDPVRARPVLAFAPGRGRALLVGGESNGGVGDTWEYDGVNWVQFLASNLPQISSGAAITHDSYRGRTLLFGGYAPAGIALGDTWEWTGGAWLLRAPSGAVPAPRAKARLAYDVSRHRAVLFGGVSRLGAILGDTWEWDGT
ncbi:MAG: PKD domain-containing protein, partial [Candidatus Wallbacteria bacterium]|nr:PKD domain-containing protein [Candidatus Wallbacteria bacterium]